jgi:hypothetical protein
VKLLSRPKGLSVSGSWTSVQRCFPGALSKTLRHPVSAATRVDLRGQRNGLCSHGPVPDQPSASPRQPSTTSPRAPNPPASSRSAAQLNWLDPSTIIFGIHALELTLFVLYLQPIRRSWSLWGYYTLLKVVFLGHLYKVASPLALLLRFEQHRCSFQRLQMLISRLHRLLGCASVLFFVRAIAFS